MNLLTEELRARIGDQRVYTAPDELGRASIRYFARAVGDDNRLYTDDEYAREWGYDGVVAPPTLVCETNQCVDADRDEDGFAGHRWDLSLPGTRQVRGGNSYEFFRPVRPGDVITTRWELVDMTERKTRDGRAMLVVTSRAEYTNQTGDLLARNEEQLIYISIGVGES
jgi:acyl dehydratase